MNTSLFSVQQRLQIRRRWATILIGAIVILFGMPGFSSARAALISNPSFESNFNDQWPHYGAIDLWTGGSGVNQAEGPFHNAGTPIPDGARVAFIQGSAKMSHEIVGLTPGDSYWLQFFYDARGCCGGTIDLVIKFNDVELDKIVNLRPAIDGKPYNFRNVLLKPESDAGTLTFETVASGDATALIDAVSLVPRAEGNVAVMNPSFEASGEVIDVSIVAPIAGWEGAGTFGINTIGFGPFTDNGTVPDQENVAFLQGGSSLSQTVANLSVGKPYQLSFAYNAPSGNNPHLEVRVGDAVVFQEDVTPVGGVNPYRTKTITFTATDISAVLTFAQTKEGAQTLLLDDIRLLGEAEKPLPPLGLSPTVAEIAPGQKAVVTVTVPEELLAIRDASVQLRIPNASVATLANADADGVVTLNFAKAGPNIQTIEATGVGRGVARLEIVNSAGLTVVSDVTVNVVSSLVRNSSFESNPAPPGIGAGEILAWSGGTGLNKSAGPFHDNGIIPDREQVAVLQGSQTLSQEITRLTAGKTYWLQFRYNARNCCGGTIDLTVRFDGKDVAAIPNITPAGEQNPYFFHQSAFTPDRSSGLLEFVTNASGDATVLLDAVSIVQGEPNQIGVKNPSFEATGNPVGVGYVQPNLISGWEITGGYGINISGVGPFTDNGAAPDQDRVLFLQGNSAASQLISGFVPGQKYTLIYAVNARNCCGAGFTRYHVTFADELIIEEEVEPVGGTNPYHWRYIVFTPQFEEGILMFQGMPEGDHTLLLDDIQIMPGEIQPPPPAFPLTIALAMDGNLEISWPLAAAAWVLESATAITGPWTAVTDVPLEQIDRVAVTVAVSGQTRFYRLRGQ